VEFAFHQALFGYDGGHQLLAASLPLSTEARHFLAVATDLSGSAPQHGFDQSYTGVALPGKNFYGLFCTWLAPEMPRPGCVWSHVLLIDLADIAELRDLGRLRRLFLRPPLAPKLEDFSHPLRFVDTLEGPFCLPTSGEPLAANLLGALYGEAEQSVVVPAAGAPTHEELIFALWSQQWPRLRRNFRFSTGSFADRGRGGPAFDIQVTPKANLSAWPRDRMLVLASGDMESTGQSACLDEPWLRIALEDLLLADSHGFRTFLRTYGADVRALRAAFVPLARMYGRLTMADRGPWIATLRTIAAEFPAPDEAGTLKLVSVSKLRSLPPDATLDALVDSVRFLCLEDTTGAFAGVDFDFMKALADLWPTRREAVAEILDKPPLTEVRWTALAKAVADCMSADEIPWLWETHPELVVPFVRLNPGLATDPGVWQLPDRSQWGVIEALEASTISQALWRDITRAMLMAGTTVAAREVTQRAGLAALDGALDWLVETPSAKLPPPLWREVLRPLAEKRLARGTLSPPELAFCATIVPATIAAGLPATRPDVQALASEPLDILPASLHVPTAFLLVTLGLQASAEVGAPLLARGFFPAHDALEGATEPPEAWRLLQPHLPLLWFWEEWDRCLKLRRALENWVYAHPNALGTILAAARKPAERRWLESLG
jgi:GTPase-associated protein 1, N-terminal domain type 1